MAKGNLFQGMARGKVGDVVFSRLDGQQISRVRNRSPKNPRTNKQLWQRAIMATIMQAYAKGKEIFDHAYEGYSVGANCQREFMRLNTRALRSRFASEIGNTELQAEETIARAIAPGVKTCVPNAYIVSTGIYDQGLFTETPTTEAGVVNAFKFNLPATSGASETVAEYAARVGMVAGDIYTIVAFLADPQDEVFRTYGIESVDYDIVYRTGFYFTRFIVKDLSAVDTLITAAKFTDLFEIEGNINNVSRFATKGIADDIDITVMTGFDFAATSAYSIGMIRSRRDQDLRSNTTLTVVNAADCGLWYGAVLDAWKKGTEDIGNSDLILEGGDEENF